MSVLKRDTCGRTRGFDLPDASVFRLLFSSAIIAASISACVRGLCAPWPLGVSGTGLSLPLRPLDAREVRGAVGECWVAGVSGLASGGRGKKAFC